MNHEVRTTEYVAYTHVKAQPPKLLTPKQFQEALGGAIGRSKIYELLRARRINSIRFGRRFLIPHEELHEFLRREVGVWS